ncbi:DUF1579 domain-containing protein [Olivibacter sp. LS-1]|jgi:hypothetical protein|uniref:DUF1579 family protein n=1 Tax=unclassified Olivibacter TaxID=2632301 RepID=UPI0011EA71D6|nr:MULTISPECIES: DUF1579 family protein [unclassified Olivibacter]MDM8175898.1 DUF1579 family protein [Olivibacter sp. 47]QEL02639.1 DUF1579 domain-containing protein [Olivibacter sp. LS-1]
MKITNLSSKFVGHWKGTYRLVLSWLPNPDFISVSNMVIKSIANDKFLMLSYDWQHEGVGQDGLILIGNINKQAGVTASWVDSWGMSGKIMNCYGTINQQGDIILLGSYEVPDNPDWGWRIEIPCPNDNALQILMYNISPEGEEFLAGDTNYTRV